MNTYMKKKYPLYITAVILVTALITGCYNDNEELLYGSSTEDCSTVQAKYVTDILPIVTTKCAIAGCHDANAPANSSGFSLLTYDELRSKVDRISVRVVTQMTMPPTGPLPPADISKFKCWIASGALNN